MLEACQRATRLKPNEARALLGRFLFSGEEAEKPLDGLSGGERRRLSIAVLVHSGANVLILDEPTNHLDLESREALEAALQEFPGALLLISHDRALLDAVGTRTIAVEDRTLHSYVGGWPEYVRVREERAEPEREAKARAKAKPRANGRAAAPAAAPPVSSKNQQREARRLEAEIEQAEAEVARIEERARRPAGLERPALRAEVDTAPQGREGPRRGALRAARDRRGLAPAGRCGGFHTARPPGARSVAPCATCLRPWPFSSPFLRPRGAAPWVETPFLPLGPDRTVTCLQPTGPGGAAYLAEDHEGDGREQVELLRVGADGTLASDASLGVGFVLGCPTVATAPGGAAVLAATAIDRGGDFIGISVRDAGGSFSRPMRIEQGAELAGGVDAAVAADGAAVVAWTETDLRGDRLVARVRAVRRAPGGAFGRPQTLSTRVADFSDAFVGIDGSGRAVVAWRGPRADGREAAWVATGAGPGTAFAAPERLGPGEDFIGGMSLAVATGGGALVVHDSFEGIRVFERSAGAPRFVRAADFPAEFDRDNPVAALADDGTAAVGWELEDDRFDSVPEIALRAPGGAFQAARRLGTDALSGARRRSRSPTRTPRSSSPPGRAER